eukprot:CAMPEP_0204531228 /NCGR_PEP_ID=MMETSP0661-20131031/11055_1 /ASSEMBLY_ACC=CAM_ASM_000606 /TAXON_ID=109239 /ORGANISM="Alexandrium margalefi, Strain AMGDE01CS-322" /LENGTH=87 /DNA_ID=CAMNT_0051537371 /DNA_START=64 /DNA_END=327 /DNA_ORIENTATION=+
MPFSDGMDKEAFKAELIKVVKAIGSVDVAEGDDLENKGVDSMDASGIQKQMVDEAPTLCGKAGMTKDELKLMQDGFKTVAEVADKCF